MSSVKMRLVKVLDLSSFIEHNYNQTIGQQEDTRGCSKLTESSIRTQHLCLLLLVSSCRVSRFMLPCFASLHTLLCIILHVYCRLCTRISLAWPRLALHCSFDSLLTTQKRLLSFYVRLNFDQETFSSVSMGSNHSLFTL